MADPFPAPQLDPESGRAWRDLAEVLFAGGGPRVHADNLHEVRAQPLVTRDVLLAGRAYVEHERTIDGPGGVLEISVFAPEDAPSGVPGIYWIHGGGMVIGDRYGVLDAMVLAVPHHGVVASVEYRLAPEHPGTAPGEDCYAGYLWFVEHAAEFGVDPARIVLAGTSAGGGLAAATALRLRDRGGPPPAAVLLACPMLDDRMTTVSVNQFGDDLLWTLDANRFGWRALLGDRCGTDDVSVYEAPARAADLGGLPPTFVDVGSADLFRDEDVAFATAIWHCGGDAELHVWPGGYHGFELIAPTSALARDSAEARRRWFARIVGDAPAG